MKSLKHLGLGVLVSGLVFAHCQAKEMRNVGGTEVDVQPLVDWAAKKKGARPLKHWKFVQIIEMKRQSAYPVLLCDLEGIRTEIMLKNCPKGLLDQANRKAELEARLAAHQKQKVGAAEDIAGGAGKRERKQTKKEIAALKKSLQADRKELGEINQALKKQRILAMDTGTIYGGLPLWDTGLQDKGLSH